MELGLLVGVREEGGIVSLSPRGAEFPSCGMHAADRYQSNSLRKGNLFTGENPVALVSSLQPLC